MAYKAYKPYEVEYRKVKNIRGKTVDAVTSELYKSYNYNPWKSTYTKDYRKKWNQQSLVASSLPQLKTESYGKEARFDTREADGRPRTGSQKSFNSKGPAGTKAVYFDGDEEFLKRNIQKDHFPDPQNPNELKLWELMQKNIRYFADIKGHNLEDMCVCGSLEPRPKPKLDLNLGSQKQSVYKKDYTPHPFDNTGNTLPFPCNAINYRVPMEMTTTNRNDYTRPIKFSGDEPQASQRAKGGGPNDGLAHLKAPFPEESMYKGQFVPWETAPGNGEGIQPIAANTVAANMPFVGRSTYKDYGNYGPEDTDPKAPGLHKKFGKSTYKNPLGPEIPFLGQTWNSTEFKPFKVGKTSGGPKIKHVDSNYPTFQNQYKTIYQDYNGNPANVCPARTILSQSKQLQLERSMKLLEEDAD